jgi:alkylation response protein AidB-like acyl-CoA dehydrogenase
MAAALDAVAPPHDDHVADSAVAERLRELAPWLAKHAPELDADGEVRREVIAALRDAGCLRLVVPAAYGGEDLPMPTVLAAIETLTRADGTLGWLIGQVALAHAVVGYLPAETVAALYAGGPDVYLAGAAASKGRAVWTGEAWRVSGRWPLVSGIAHADWVYMQCVVAHDGDVPALSDEVPEMRTVLFPAAEVRVIRTYRGLGLIGSGSNDAHVSGALCPPAHTCDLLAQPAVASACSRVPVRTQAGLVAAAFMTGTALAALDAIAALAPNKRPAFSTRVLAQSPRFQESLGEAFATLAAARALLYTEVAAADAASRPIDDSEEAFLRAVGPKVGELAGSVVDTAYALGGSSSVADISPLQRRLRDARTISQHATLSSGYYAPVGTR